MGFYAITNNNYNYYESRFASKNHKHVSASRPSLNLPRDPTASGKRNLPDSEQCASVARSGVRKPEVRFVPAETFGLSLRETTGKQSEHEGFHVELILGRKSTCSEAVLQLQLQAEKSILSSREVRCSLFTSALPEYNSKAPHFLTNMNSATGQIQAASTAKKPIFGGRSMELGTLCWKTTERWLLARSRHPKL